MLIVVLSATIILIIFEYIHKSLKLYPSTRLYWELLDKVKITYIVSKIVKPNFENLGFFMFKGGRKVQYQKK